VLDELFGSHIGRLQTHWASALDEVSVAGAIVASGAPVLRFEDDEPVPFRVNPRYRQWVPAGRHTHSFLVVQPGRRPRLICHLPADYWHSVPSRPRGFWTRHFDIEMVDSPERAIAALPSSRQDWAVLGDPQTLNGLAADESSLNPAALIARLDFGRAYKSDYEIECVRRANEMAAAAHIKARDRFLGGHSELEIHLAYLQSVGHTEAELPYGNIVALNEHGATLHYDRYDHGPPGESRSFLIDAGARFLGYAADITRTWSHGGGLFGDLVEALDRAQLDLIEQIEIGGSFVDLHVQTHVAVAGILRELGLVEMSDEAMLQEGVTAAFFPHGLGHHLGLQVHDVGGKLAAPDGALLAQPDDHPFLRNLRPIEVGNVFTIEPGVYFIEQLMAGLRETATADRIDWARVESLVPYGGVRIEDNIAATADGTCNLTRQAFAGLVD
jgi:Xaa-Pro dipeptidase